MSSPIPSAPPPPAPDALARQNALLKKLVGGLLVALLAGAGAFLYVRHQAQPVAILLDGKPITTARNAAQAETVLRAAERAKVGRAYPDSSIVRLQKVGLVRLAGSPVLDTTDAARAKLEKALKLHVRVYAIFVNGKPALGLPSDEAAADTLHRVKEHFAQMPPTTEIMREPEFMERVAVKQAGLDASLTRPDAASAAPYFWTPPASRTYTVHRGDSGLAIARRSHISLTDLIVANAGQNINRLKPGSSLNVQKMPLLLSVRVQKRLTRDEKIIPNAPDAQAGQRRVIYAITYINGQETRRDVLSMNTLTPPAVRMSL